MIRPSPSSSVFFRTKPCKRKGVDAPRVLEVFREEEASEGEYLACKSCLALVTVGTERIEVHGAHAHSFTNPHGLFFDIGCFRQAPGCAYAGEPSSEFTWFAGFSWQIAVCRSCLEHLGWLFSSEGSRFTGLILDKIVPVSSGPSSSRF